MPKWTSHWVLIEVQKKESWSTDKFLAHLRVNWSDFVFFWNWESMPKTITIMPAHKPWRQRKNGKQSLQEYREKSFFEKRLLWLVSESFHLVFVSIAEYIFWVYFSYARRMEWAKSWIHSVLIALSSPTFQSFFFLFIFFSVSDHFVCFWKTTKLKIESNAQMLTKKPLAFTSDSLLSFFFCFRTKRRKMREKENRIVFILFVQFVLVEKNIIWKSRVFKSAIVHEKKNARRV